MHGKVAPYITVGLYTIVMNITGTILHSLIKTTVMTQLYVIWNEVVYNYMHVCLAEIFY